MRNIDDIIQKRVDQVTGWLETKEIMSPKIQRELIHAEMACCVLILVMAWVSFGASILTALLAMTTATATMVAWLRRMLVAPDADREWTPALAEKYSNQALEARESNLTRLNRLSSVACIVLFTALMIYTWGGPTSEWQRGVFTLLGIWAVRQAIETFRLYVESSIPLPPKQKHHSFATEGAS